MSRAALLSTGGDPFITNLVIELWKKYWYDEVDRLYINYNNHAQVPLNVVNQFIAKIIQEPKIHLIYHPKGLGNGLPVTEMVHVAREDLFLLLEDDGYIFSSGYVDKYFKEIENNNYDALGSPRGSCGQEIWDRSKEKYGLDYSGYGDVGPNYWPNFFFCKRDDLLKTDLNFDSVAFNPGEYNKELDYTFKEISHGDTFVWMCMQLRAMNLRFQNIPQFHASPFEIDEKERGDMNWRNGKPYWIHAGSLSAGLNGYLSGRMPDLSTDSAMQEIETRCAFWTIASDIEDFGLKVQYKKAIEELISKGNLNKSRIDRKIKIYKDLINL